MNELFQPGKFQNPAMTARGERRAAVRLKALETLWVNTGTLCNLTCGHCYIESSPRNDRLSYISAAEVRAYLDEIRERGLPVRTIGFTGGEPFMNPQIMEMLEDALGRGFAVLVLTNAMLPMQHKRAALLALKAAHGERLTLRVSVDHYTQSGHEAERGARSWEPTIRGLTWLHREGFALAIAGRLLSGEPEAEIRSGFARMFTELGLNLDAQDPEQLVIFPEMDEKAEVPEITESCWDILKVDPDTIMCATSRMVVKRRGADRPAVLSCTLLPYDPQFELGATLEEAESAVPLNHPHCAKFCVLGGASCGG
jgi:MoaA/NifB/PqqE/SkfB family radical SAM enzyme